MIASPDPRLTVRSPEQCVYLGPSEKAYERAWLPLVGNRQYPLDQTRVLRRFQSGIPSARFEPASGEATLSGVAVETDDATGFATKIAPVRKGGRLSQTAPDFW